MWLRVYLRRNSKRWSFCSSNNTCTTNSSGKPTRAGSVGSNASRKQQRGGNGEQEQQDAVYAGEPGASASIPSPSGGATRFTPVTPALPEEAPATGGEGGA